MQETNLSIILNFPVDNEYAQIKADAKGYLFCSDGSYTARTSAYFTGTTFEKTAEIIKTTCKIHLEDKKRAKNSNEWRQILNNSTDHEDSYETEDPLYDSLERIMAVYKKRHGKDHPGVKTLSETIELFGRPKPQEKYVESSWNNSPKNDTWFTSTGSGPTFLGSVYSGVNTYFYGTNPLTLEDFNSYMQKMPLNLIQGLSFEKESTLEMLMKGIIFNILPTVIPVYSSHHMAVILIKDKCVEYYDPKGVTSEKRALSNGTLHDVLEFCQKTFDCQHIVENPYTHQYDSHNSIVFVCRHIHDRLENNSLMGAFSAEIPDIAAFREKNLDKK